MPEAVTDGRKKKQGREREREKRNCAAAAENIVDREGGRESKGGRERGREGAR